MANSDIENVDIGSASDYMPTSAKSFNEFATGRSDGVERLGTNYGILGNIHNFFTGERDQNEKNYELYLQNLNAENAAKAANYANDLAYARDLKAIQDAREWDKMMSDTQYQRAVADLKAAGLNPWLALQNGVSGSSVPNSGKAESKVTTAKSSQYKKVDNEKKSGARDLSLLLFAVARLMAA